MSLKVYKDLDHFKFEMPEPKLSKNARLTLERRYLRRNESGTPIESIKDLFCRVAWAISEPESSTAARSSLASKLYTAMTEGYFMFNTPTLFNAGTNNGLSLSACFVRVPEDSLDDIMKVCYDLALIQKSGGGVGYDFSKLRPKGSIVKSCGATTDGPLPFIDMYCAATNAIQQGAKRRGAQMGMLDIHHPDVWDFIQAKSDLKRWQNMNVSLKVTDEWMQLVKIAPNRHHVVRHEKWGEGVLVKDENGKVEARKVPLVSEGGPLQIKESESFITVGNLFDEICRRAWSTGEPGLAFWDRVNKDWVFSETGKYPIQSTNPCGEVPLEDGGSCNLGSINLNKFVKSNETLDETSLREHIELATRALDNVVEVNKFPLDILAKVNRDTRRIGIGPMGFAGMLFRLGIRYGSDESIYLAKRLSSIFKSTATAASIDLAVEKGSFLAIKDSNYPYSPKRNAYTCMIAPTGTISIITDCEAGIEPIFSLAFKREVLQDASGKFVEMTEVNPIFDAALTQLLGKYLCDIQKEVAVRDEVIEYVMKNGTLAGFTSNLCSIQNSQDWIDFANVFVTAKDITPEEHVNMQAAWQTDFDQAISKTINLNNNATIEDVKKAYILAFDKGCKGITVYRDGSRHNVEGMKQPMQLSSEPLPESKLKTEISNVKSPKTLIETPSDLNDEVDYKNLIDKYTTELQMQPTADVLDAVRVRQQTPLGNLHVNMVHSNGVPIEIFAQLSKAGDMATADLEAISRLVSMYLRSGGKMDEVIKQLKDIGSNNARPTADGSIKSLPDGLAVALTKAVNYLNGPRTEVTTPNKNLYTLKCPECNGPLEMKEKCQSCSRCGYSKC